MGNGTINKPSVVSDKSECSGWEPFPDERWEEETLRLLNDGELGEALKMFRQHHRMVNRFVCMDCGFTSPNFVHGKGCEKCESDKIETRVVVDPPNDLHHLEETDRTTKFSTN